MIRQIVANTLNILLFFLFSGACFLWFGLWLWLFLIRIVDHFMLDQPRDAYSHGVGLIITGVLALADELRQGFGHVFLLGKAVAGDGLLDSLGVDLVELATAKAPGVKIGDADHLVQDLDRIRIVILRTAMTDNNGQRLFADDGSERNPGQQTPKLGRDLGKNLSVAFLLAGIVLVVDVRCLLYLDFPAIGIIPQDGKAGTVIGEITGQDIRVG